MKRYMIETAERYIASGLSVLPTNRSSKTPMLENWRRLQSNRLTRDECERAFYPDCNIAVVCGAISGNLEVIDFDNKSKLMLPMFDEFKCCIDTLRLPYEKTKSGGYHVFYRCDVPVSGNMKLAQIHDMETNRPSTIIETRGEGGYVVVAPSTGYQLVEGDITDIPVVSEEQRRWILTTCKGCNQVEPEEYLNPSYGNTYSCGDDDRVGDRYNASSEAMLECRTLLEEAGWKFSQDGRKVTRPGKTDGGFSATFGVMTSRLGVPLFHVFTSNGSPFEQDKSYSPFAVYSMLKWDGNFRDAAAELGRRMGDTPKKEPKRTDADPPKFVKTDIANERDGRMKKTSEDSVQQADKTRKKKEEVERAEDYLNDNYDFRLDEIKHTVEWRRKGEPFYEEANLNDIYISLQHLGIKFGQDSIAALLGSSYVKSYNPFHEYFDNLPRWDGIDWFGRFFDYIKVDNREFFTKMLEKQFVRAIKCALEPEFYNRFAFIFRSREQEIGKSRLVQYLNPLPQKYFCDEFFTGDKDSAISLTESFIYSLEELDDVNKLGGGMAKLKAMIAKKSFNGRLPYGKTKTLLYRCCTFFGTANSVEFLTDDVNTRWIVCTIKELNQDIFTEIDINKLWAQAFSLYNSYGYEWDLTRDERIEREKINLYFRQSSIEQEILAMHFQIPEAPDVTMTLGEIANAMPFYGHPGIKLNTSLTYLQDVLDAMGYKHEDSVSMNTVIKNYHIERKDYGLSR